jgi:hypothetical protein
MTGVIITKPSADKACIEKLGEACRFNNSSVKVEHGSLIKYVTYVNIAIFNPLLLDNFRTEVQNPHRRIKSE